MAEPTYRRASEDGRPGPGGAPGHAVRAAAVRAHSLRLTWAWLWTGLALALLALAAGVITLIALAGSDRDEVTLAVALIGFPAALGALALGTLAVVTAKPKGTRWQSVRRWALALAAGVALVGGLASLEQDVEGGALLIAAGAGVLALVALDVRRGRGE